VQSETASSGIDSDEEVGVQSLEESEDGSPQKVNYSAE
jgi:hypothetical protein